MRRLLVLGVLLTLATPAAAAPRHCRGLPWGRDGGRVAKLRATGATCHAARSVANAFRGSYYCAVAEGCTVLNGYLCEERGDGSVTTVGCVREGGRRVTWRQHLPGD
jgi:hypothetical protein